MRVCRGGICAGALRLACATASAFLVLSTMASSASGIGSFGFAIPPSLPLAGMNLNAQGIWLWNPAVCTPSPFGWSSSHGLSITLQP